MKSGCQVADPPKILGEIQTARPQRPTDHTGRLRPESEIRSRPKPRQFLASQLGRNSIKWTDKVVDHSVGFRMVHIKTAQFAVADHVQSGEFLGLENHQSGIAEVP